MATAIIVSAIIIAIALIVVASIKYSCKHEFEIIEKYCLYDNTGSPRPAGRCIISRCKKCGQLNHDEFIF